MLNPQSQSEKIPKNEDPKKDIIILNILELHHSSNEKKKFMIECRYEDKISDVIERYRNESNDNRKKLRLIYRAKPLHPNKTVRECDIINNANIIALDPTEGIVG